MGVCILRARSARGNALVLSMMILLSLTAVGIMSVMRTNTELMVSGNVARSMQAGLAAEAGLFHALGLVAGSPPSYTLAAIAQRDAANSARSVDMSGLQAVTCTPPSASKRLAVDVACRSSALDVPNPAQHLPVVQPAAPLELARLNQDLAYDSELIPLGEREVTGFGLDDRKICHGVFDFNARGGIPTKLEAISSTLCPRNDPACVAETVVIETRARAVAGPIPCK
ncbi:MAG TPA: pilus assembly PilX N-terminal domain-containing protein [Myxococcota bacterium]|nr:pilus assembly PilX N-terminal domain-containing protein [Myxococcota bacterium]HRY95125.1 pilus assembly PilX N-terminal domain-containing protein [Myxococcota bacterium]